MTKITALVLMVLALPLSSRAGNDRPLRVVPEVDFSRYAGLWYEIARLPNRFQKDCTGEVTARYTVESDAKIDVVNRCRVAGGEFIEAKGVARLKARDEPNSMLKVRFAPAFLSFIPQVWGDYQILVLGPDYRYALVGAPSREYLWILSRSRELDDDVYRALVEEARQQGFNVDLLERTE